MRPANRTEVGIQLAPPSSPVRTRAISCSIASTRAPARCLLRFAQSSLEKPTIQELYASLVKDPIRNDLIFDDILTALEAGRSPVVITERKNHVTMLADRLARFAKNV